jgi:hypothetical protein
MIVSDILAKIPKTGKKTSANCPCAMSLALALNTSLEANVTPD